MAHILFAYKQFPAPSIGHAGGESLYHLMEALQRRGHRVSLVARLREDERPALSVTAALCTHLITVPHHRSLPGTRPWAMAVSYVRFRRAVARAIREWHPDLLHIETTQTAAVLAGLRLPPSSYRPQDLNWLLMEQQALRSTGLARRRYRMLSRLLKWGETALARRHPVLLAISEGDRGLLAAASQLAPLLLPLAPGVTSVLQPSVPAGPPTLLFVGAMSRDHNVTGVLWFLDQVWPRILAELPDARFVIVGKDPPPELRARADGARVEVTGFVEDLAPWYSAATAVVVPLLVAGGLLQKMLDAMAMGLPVLATSVCNHGIGASAGEHLLLADTPEVFAARAVDLLRDAELRRRLGAAGRAFVLQRFDFEAAVDRWEQALLALQPAAPMSR